MRSITRLIAVASLACVLSNALHALPRYDLAYTLSGAGGMMMEDGKVDPFIGRPILGGQFAVEFLPTGRWHCLQQWNNASIGVGAAYLNLGNEAKLGSAFAAFAYMNQPFYNGTHFRIGARPTVGLAALSKRYSNTLPDGYKPYYQGDGGFDKANQSIGSILNAYLAMELYMDFPIKDGWEITLAGGWHHMSNGSVMHPNAGYNLFGAELGVRYAPSRSSSQSRPSSPPSTKELHDEVEKPWAVEISATGGMKQNYYADNQHGQKFYGVATLKAAAYWVPVSIFRIGGGFDAFYDGYYAAVNSEYANDNAGAPVTYFGKTYLRHSKVKNCFRMGFSIQPEFIIGRLTAGLHVGFYIIDPVKNLEPYDKSGEDPDAIPMDGEPFNRGIFYRYNFMKASTYQDGWCYMQFILKYHMLDNMFVQLGLKTHGVRAEFIDAGIGVAF